MKDSAQPDPQNTCDTSLIKRRLLQLFNGELETVKKTISNEHLWELVYAGSGPNPHSGNIAIYMHYLDALEQLKEQAEIMDI